MCPKLIELLSWNGPTVHVCCFMLARASTKTFVSRVKKNSEKKLRQPKNSLAGSLVSRDITVQGLDTEGQPVIHCGHRNISVPATTSELVHGTNEVAYLMGTGDSVQETRGVEA